MKTVLKLLRKELREWKKQEKIDREFFKGEEKDWNAKRDFRVNKKHIDELEEAIGILENSEHEEEMEFAKQRLEKGH